MFASNALCGAALFPISQKRGRTGEVKILAEDNIAGKCLHGISTQSLKVLIAEQLVLRIVAHLQGLKR